MLNNILRLLCVTCFVYSANVPPLFLYPVLEQINCAYNPTWLTVKNIKVTNLGTANFAINASTTTLKVPDSTTVTLTLFRSNGEIYSPFGRPITHKICDYIKNDKLFYPDIVLHSNYPKSCPIEAKDYEIVNYRMNFQNLASVMPVGRYKIVANVTTTQERGFAVIVLVRAVQQNVKFGQKTEEEPTTADVHIETY